MNVSQVPTPDNSAPHAEAGPITPPHRPTSEERLSLIHALQNQALQRKDPLMANLEMMSADLMLIARDIKDAIQANLANAVPPTQQAEQFQRHLENYLRCTRQIDRFANITRQSPSKATSGLSSD
jgi:hypothetical protein